MHIKNTKINISKSYNTQKISTFILIFVCLTLSIAAAFRIFGIDRDYDDYINFYNNGGEYFGERFEPAFYWAVKLFTNASLDFKIFLFFISFFSLLLKFTLIIKIAKNPWFWIFCYFLSLYPLHEMTQIRAALSLGLKAWVIN